MRHRWVEVPALDQLITALQQGLAAAGFPNDNREFKPHVTLLRNLKHVLEPQAITPIGWQVDSFVLVESVKTDRRMHYQILQRWPLAPVAA